MKKRKEPTAGYLKKSFVLPYNGGEIRFEHLDGLSDREELVLEKLAGDVNELLKPSAPAYVCFVFSETTITDNIIAAEKIPLLSADKRFPAAAFVGAEKAAVRKIKRGLSGKGFALEFFEGIEDAKEWLLG